MVALYDAVSEDHALKRIALLLAPSLLAAAAIGGLPARAKADTSVIVLGLRSVEGDDEFARNLTGALRHAAAQVPGWSVSDREVSLSQMSLAHDCDEPDARCMGNIATALQVQRVVYGTVRRTSARENYRLSIALHIFNAENGQIEESVTDTVAHNRTDIDDLREPARAYISRLSGQPQTGSVVVRANVQGAEVRLDGAPAGSVAEGGVFTATNVPVGRHRIEVIASGHTTFRSTVTITPGDQAEIEVQLVVGEAEPHVAPPMTPPVEPTSSGRGTIFWLGVGAVGIAVVLGIVSAWAWFKNNGIEDTDPWRRYKTAWPGDGATDSDFCDRVLANDPPSASAMLTTTQVDDAHNLCNDSNDLVTVWLVTLIGAVAVGIGGVALISADLLSDDSSSAEDRASAPSLSLLPSLDPLGRAGHLTATLRF